MADLAVSAGVSSVAHGVHYTVLGIGLLGLLVLLAPGGRTDRVPLDAHAVRVQALRRAVAAGTLGTSEPTPPPAPPRAAAPTPSARLWLPLAVVSSTAAAGVHAAVGPAHFREQTVLGLFFVVATLAQLAWSIGLVLRPSAALLRVGAAGNAALVVLWAVTRTLGLPGLLPGPEAVGPWDLACVAWELVAVFACVEGLLARAAGAPAYRVAGWVDWDTSARLWTEVSVVGLGLLSISGAGS